MRMEADAEVTLDVDVDRIQLASAASASMKVLRFLSRDTLATCLRDFDTT